jgi:hypothetical protein
LRNSRKKAKCFSFRQEKKEELHSTILHVEDNFPTDVFAILLYLFRGSVSILAALRLHDLCSYTFVFYKACVKNRKLSSPLVESSFQGFEMARPIGDASLNSSKQSYVFSQC